MAAVVDTKGSIPGKTGFKLVVGEDGTLMGTVGGGEIEKRAIEECRARIQSGVSGLQEYLLQQSDSKIQAPASVEVVPMMCNGKVWIYYDVIKNRIPVYIFGGGHVGHAVSHFLHKLDYYLYLIDDREEFITEKKNPYFHERTLEDYPKYALTFMPQPDAFVVIVTQGHGYDYEVARILYERELPLQYIGAIASRTKSATMIKQLQEDLGESTRFDNLYTPIGIDIGGSTENEIALSIAAQIQAIRFQKGVTHLRREA